MQFGLSSEKLDRQIEQRKLGERDPPFWQQEDGRQWQRSGRMSFAFRRVLLVTFVHASLSVSALATCTAPQNAIEAENCLPGNPSSEWYVDGAGSPNIQGFTTDMSVNVGQTVFFKIATDAMDYRIDIYRLGYYQGNGARLIASNSPSASLPQAQPPCLRDSSTGLIDCGNWAISASWTVPSSATSGIYFAKLLRLDTGEASPIIFVVRKDSSHSDILVQTSDTTWQAYNDYGGNSLYSGNPVGRAYKVSYNRPVNDFLSNFFSNEYNIIRWLEANGYDVSYFSGVDRVRNGSLITQHRVFMSVGHDVFWSGGQRANVEAARDAAVNLAFFSGNEVVWKTRWEAGIDGTNSPYRTLVCYKERFADPVIDPLDPPTWTGLWRDPRFSPPADGGRPENALSGTLSTVSAPANDPINVPQADGRMRFWRNTSVATLGPGQVYTLPTGVLGYEWDEDADNGFRPAGLIRLSTTTVPVSTYLYSSPSGYYFGNANATHHLTMYRAPSGALVFGAGTIHWSWAVENDHGGFSGALADPNAKQATVNLLADMGVQPATLQSDLVPATASTDTSPPRSTITSPAPGTTVTVGSVTVSGTAQDFGGGEVGAVEISLDGGKTWHPAAGRENWSYSFTTGNSGTLSVQSRAADDSGNLEVPSPGITVTAVPQPCPCTIWPSTAAPATVDAGPYSPLELGVQFRADSDGYITGIRFYKSAANTGTHVGHLWSSSGALLASVTFTGETASGWQQANFSGPVAITANTLYVASYQTSVGHFSLDPGYFATFGVDDSPLHAFADSGGASNGVYAFTSTGAYPTTTYNASNYWIDVVFNFNAAAAPLKVSTTSLPNGAQSVAYSQSLAAAGGTAPYSWSLLSGTLPSGLAPSASGIISGTPTSVGTNNFVVQVTDSSAPAQSATQALSITIAGPGGSQSNAALNGNYAFTFTGVSGNGIASSTFAAVGRFTADGAGNLSNGELDTNAVGGGGVAQAFTGTYSIGADNRGVMTLNFSGSSAKMAFAMLANGNAQFIEFDASGGSGTIGSGTMEKADTTAYSTARITGDYAFGAAGFDNANNRAAIEGRVS